MQALGSQKMAPIAAQGCIPKPSSECGKGQLVCEPTGFELPSTKQAWQKELGIRLHTTLPTYIPSSSSCVSLRGGSVVQGRRRGRRERPK